MERNLDERTGSYCVLVVVEVEVEVEITLLTPRRPGATMTRGRTIDQAKLTLTLETPPGLNDSHNQGKRGLENDEVQHW